MGPLLMGLKNKQPFFFISRADLFLRAGFRGGVVWRRGGVRIARSGDWPDGCNGRRSRLTGGMELLPIATSGKGNGVRLAGGGGEGGGGVGAIAVLVMLVLVLMTSLLLPLPSSWSLLFAVKVSRACPVRMGAGREGRRVLTDSTLGDSRSD